jgi:hypothetical protein
MAAISNNIAASGYSLVYTVLGWSRRNQRSIMMNHLGGWMSGWADGGMWIWMAVGLLVVVLVAVGINKLYSRRSSVHEPPVK